MDEVMKSDPSHLALHEEVSPPPDSSFRTGFDDGDDDSTYGERPSSSCSTFSLTSSIAEAIVENGRTYAGWFEDYYLPNDKAEQEREQHVDEVWLEIFDGCPLRSNPKPGGVVIDAGTGTGKWALRYADEHPETIVFGVDISPIQPNWVPPNCRFFVDDIEVEPNFKEPIHLIFCRNLAGAIRDWPKFLRTWFRSLEPGGCIEILDFAPITATYKDGKLEETELYTWSRSTVQVANQAGRSIDQAPHLASMLKEAGFIMVKEEKQDVPVRKKDGLTLYGFSLYLGIRAMTIRPFTKLGLPLEAVLHRCRMVEKDLEDPCIRASATAYIVYGRKPDVTAASY